MLRRRVGRKVELRGWRLGPKVKGERLQVEGLGLSNLEGEFKKRGG